MTSTDHSHDDDRRGGIVRRVLSAGPNPEERLEELLAQRRRELDAHAEQLHASIAELERREELLRDSRASVERMLRLGTSDLEARETELTGYLRELTDAGEGARRERRGARTPTPGARSRRAQARRGRASRARRRSARAEVAEREAAAPAVAIGRSRSPSSSRSFRERNYALVELEAVELTPGLELEVADETFVVARIGRSPLPGDSRRCAYLVRGARGRESSSPGSS